MSWSSGGCLHWLSLLLHWCLFLPTGHITPLISFTSRTRKLESQLGISKITWPILPFRKLLNKQYHTFENSQVKVTAILGNYLTRGGSHPAGIRDLSPPLPALSLPWSTTALANIAHSAIGITTTWPTGLLTASALPWTDNHTQGQEALLSDKQHAHVRFLSRWQWGPVEQCWLSCLHHPWPSPFHATHKLWQAERSQNKTKLTSPKGQIYPDWAFCLSHHHGNSVRNLELCTKVTQKWCLPLSRVLNLQFSDSLKPGSISETPSESACSGVDPWHGTDCKTLVGWLAASFL